MKDSKFGIQLDIGCGSNKQKGFVGMDKRDIAGVDIVHDFFGLCRHKVGKYKLFYILLYRMKDR